MDETEQDVLGADVVVVEHPGFFLSQDDNPTRSVGEPLKHAHHVLTAGSHALPLKRTAQAALQPQRHQCSTVETPAPQRQVRPFCPQGCAEVSLLAAIAWALAVSPDSSVTAMQWLGQALCRMTHPTAVKIFHSAGTAQNGPLPLTGEYLPP
ncbi:hypothetical protein JCM9534A_69590 [Catenuloplanes indicus JCM 9534]